MNKSSKWPEDNFSFTNKVNRATSSRLQEQASCGYGRPQKLSEDCNIITKKASKICLLETKSSPLPQRSVCDSQKEERRCSNCKKE
jgi:hypothetical protein